MSDAEVQRVLTTIARPAVAGPVVLVAGSATFQVTPAMIARNLRFEAANGKLVPVVDGHGIAAGLPTGALSALEAPAKNASFDVSSGAPVIVPSVTGGTADLEKLGPAIAAVLPQAKPVRVDVPATGIEAAFTTAAAQRLGIKQMVSTFTTHHPCCAARVHNIHTIADIVNGHLIMPGETFSLNKFVGPRDTRRGFVEAPMIEDGLFINSVGGGVSQFATTMYNAVFFAALKDIEHHPHSYYISRYPAGREATVSYPNPNLIFQNDTATGILVTTSYTGTSLTVTFWGTKYYDVVSTASGRYKPTTAGIRYNTRPDCERASGGSGFQIDVTQTLLHGGVVTKKNVLHTRYDPEPVIICGASPSPTPPALEFGYWFAHVHCCGALGVAPSTPPSPKPSPRSSPPRAHADAPEVEVRGSRSQSILRGAGSGLYRGTSGSIGHTSWWSSTCGRPETVTVATMPAPCTAQKAATRRGESCWVGHHERRLGEAAPVDFRFEAERHRTASEAQHGTNLALNPRVVVGGRSREAEVEQRLATTGDVDGDRQMP